jgi:hypothetical protein
MLDRQISGAFGLGETVAEMALDCTSTLNYETLFPSTKAGNQNDAVQDEALSICGTPVHFSTNEDSDCALLRYAI